MRKRQFIDGRWCEPRSGAYLRAIDPASEEPLAEVADGDAVDVGLAVDAARNAFRAWRRTSGRERGVLLRALGDRVLERRDELARLETLDNGKPLPEARWDVEDAAGCFHYYAELAEALDGRQWEPVAVPHGAFRSAVVREPVGVAGQIVPWNYPLLMAAWKVAPALAAGCTCVLKPSELTSLTALELADVGREVELPAGVLNVVTGRGASAGAALADHPGIDKMAFTGSVATGRRIMQAAAAHVRPVTLELGGKSAIIVFDDVATEQAVEWILFGVFWNQGQVCSATSRLLVEERAYDRVIGALVEAARAIRIGSGLEDGVLLGPLVSAGQRAKVQAFVAGARAAGGHLLTGGGVPPGRTRGYFFEPTVLADVPLDSAAWREEIFGPVLCVRTFRDEAEAVRLANDTPFGLAGAVMTTDEARACRVAAELEAGIVWINCSQPTFTQAPWGGRKQSGIGRELGPWGLDNYLAVKQVTSFDPAQRWGWYLKA